MWNLERSHSAARSGELLLGGLFGAERALGAALTLESVAAGQRGRALLPARHAALPLLPVHHLADTRAGRSVTMETAKGRGTSLQSKINLKTFVTFQLGMH